MQWATNDRTSMSERDTVEDSKDKPLFERPPDFAEKYANNVRFESSVWDLKILFGLLDQSGESAVTKQHTAVNVPWMQAKLMIYFLYVNVLFHEMTHGRIRVPDSIMPEPIGDFFDRWEEDPQLKPVIEYLQQMRTRFLGASDGKTAENPPNSPHGPRTGASPT